MGICLKGLDLNLENEVVPMVVTKNHNLIRLGNTIDWVEMKEIVFKDLKKTTKGYWWVGRKLILRTHLAVYILQTLVKATDREMYARLQENAFYQVFCGRSIVSKWHSPHFSKIEEFRNRLSAETQRQIVTYVIQVAERLGFADVSKMDLDSTVQEANMAYPSDANLLVKLGLMSQKVIEFAMKQPSIGHKISDIARDACSRLGKLGEVVTQGVDWVEKKMGKIKTQVDMKAIKSKSQKFFFLSKNASKVRRREVFKELYQTVTKQVMPVVTACSALTQTQLQALPWNIKQAVKIIQEHALTYLDAVKYYTQTGKMKSGKILSFHLKQVACIVKNKSGKPWEFGRVFQLGRLGGNFMLVLEATSVRMSDKHSVIPAILEHAKIFGKGKLESFGADKGYYSGKNVKEAKKTVSEVGIQAPGNIKNRSNLQCSQDLKDRRAGIEPLIGHVKKFGLEKSRMKSDITTLTSGYRSVLGFNLHQLIRCQSAGLGGGSQWVI